MNQRLRVYVAGPITLGDRDENIQSAIQAGRELIERGCAAYVPHLDYFMFPEGLDWDVALECDEPWLACADIVLRLPGESKGADREVELADSLAIPVVYSVAEAAAWAIS